MNRWDWSCWFQRMYWPILPVSDHLEEKKLISEDCPILSVFGHGHGPFESHISWFSHLLSAGCFLRQPTDSLRFMKECTHSLMDFWCTLRTQRIHAPKPHYCTKLGVWTYFCNEINWKCSAHKMHPDLDKCWTYWYVFALGNNNFVLKIDCSNFRTPGLKQKKLVFKLFQFQNYFNFKINA